MYDLFDDALAPMESQETPDLDLECHEIDLDSAADPIYEKVSLDRSINNPETNS